MCREEGRRVVAEKRCSNSLSLPYLLALAQHYGLVVKLMDECSI